MTKPDQFRYFKTSREIIPLADMLRRAMPDLKLQVVNVVNLMALAQPHDHPNGVDDSTFVETLGEKAPIVFAFHGYRSLIRDLIFERPCRGRLRIFGYREEGTTTTPFDMAVLNGIDRFNLAMQAMDSMSAVSLEAQDLRRWIGKNLDQHRSYIQAHREDMPEVQGWRLSTLTGVEG